MVNTLSVGDKILMFETGHFSTLWYDIAERFGLEIDFIKGDWRTGVDPNVVEQKLKEDKEKKIKAVCAVHNETSTGVTSRIGEIRKAMDNANHPALLFVDTISSLGSIDYKHEEWKVDVTVGGSQKGLLLPPGLSFNAISSKALEAYKKSDLPKSYWDWEPMIESNKKGHFPYTPATNLLYGLDEAINMLMEEGLENVFNRHKRFAEATRIAVNAWGLEVLCKNPEEYSNTLTAVLVPEGHDADALRKIILDDYNMSLGAGLAKVAGKIFRIGHLGDFNELMLAGTLAGVEMGLMKSKIPYKKGGILKALEYLS
jgi:alanine-glyoxylate transaminase/serine-glyoxylate transaminase/serine-pyruvate transaminase